MEKLTINKIGFGSHAKYFFLNGFCCGLAAGVLMLIASLFGAPIWANLASTQYTGLTAGVIALLISPISFGLFLTWFGVLSYLPFKLLLKARGIKLRVQYLESQLGSDNTFGETDYQGFEN